MRQVSIFLSLRAQVSRLTRLIVNFVIYINTGKLGGIARLYYVNSSASAVLYRSLVSRKVPIGADTVVDNSSLLGRVSIGVGCRIKEAKLEGSIVIGNYSSLWGPGIVMNSIINPIHIGNYCSIAQNVLFYEYNHLTDGASTSFINCNIFGGEMASCIDSKGPITVKNDVWIGAGSMILSGVTIGNGAVIGAGSLISKDVPDYAIMGGNPAKILGYRFDREIIDRFLKIEWWLWPLDKVLSNKEFFTEKIDSDFLDDILAECRCLNNEIEYK